jgi:hypothetical protein
MCSELVLAMVVITVEVSVVSLAVQGGRCHMHDAHMLFLQMSTTEKEECF